MSNDDEWDKVEEQLNLVRLTWIYSIINSFIFIFKQQQEREAQKFAYNQSDYENRTIEETEEIDTALLSAASNPRERMNLFNTENVLLNFVKSRFSILNYKLFLFPLIILFFI
jgi:hypothetical protein